MSRKIIRAKTYYYFASRFATDQAAYPVSALVISTKQLFIAGLRDIARILSRRWSVSRKRGPRSASLIPFVQLMTSRCRERRGASRADGNVKKICRGKEDKGPVSGEARRLFRIHDDPRRYRERIESNWNRAHSTAPRSAYVPPQRQIAPLSFSRSASSFFRFSRRPDISFARPLILERTKT